MHTFSPLVLGATTALFAVANAVGTTAELVGTWTTKSNMTLTGTGFFNYTADKLIEPSRTGFSYSFTADGYYEESFYRAISNPSEPTCPSAILQWQHGSWVANSDGSITLSPIKVDGRQLLSEPCTYKNSIYTRYNQSETFTFSIYEDSYNGRMRLDLFGYDGEPENPMWMYSSTPIMCPTTTLNPTATASATSKAKRNVKRGAEFDVPLNWKTGSTRETIARNARNPDTWWWTGMALTGIGGLLYFGPRRMGIQL